jgi:hypothetical protein
MGRVFLTVSTYTDRLCSWYSILLDLTDPHVANLGFKGPNFRVGLPHKYRASPVDSKSSGNTRQLSEKLNQASYSPPLRGEIT